MSGGVVLVQCSGGKVVAKEEGVTYIISRPTGAAYQKLKPCF
jgi:hypothetical protein